MESGVITNKARIQQVIADNLSRSFQWGDWDCCIFVFECFDPDNVDLLRGRYSDQAGGWARAEELGGIDGYLISRGATRVAKGECRTGDIVCFENGNGIGIVERAEVVTLYENGDMVRLPRSIIESGWRFPRG